MEESLEESSFEDTPTFSQTNLAKISNVHNEAKESKFSVTFLQSDRSERELAKEHPIKHLWNDVEEPYLCEIDSYMISGS